MTDKRKVWRGGGGQGGLPNLQLPPMANPHDVQMTSPPAAAPMQLGTPTIPNSSAENMQCDGARSPRGDDAPTRRMDAASPALRSVSPDIGPRRIRMNSTHTILAKSSISQPNVEEILRAVSVVISLHMCENPPNAAPSSDANRRLAMFNEVTSPEYLPPPPVGYIFKFLKVIFDCAQFSVECLILALIFVNRLIGKSGLALDAKNWRLVVVISLIVAQKVWDDRSLINAQFAMICPMFSLDKLNLLEQVYLRALQFDISVSPHLYAKYYFELRTLSADHSHDFEVDEKKTDFAQTKKQVAQQLALPKATQSLRTKNSRYVSERLPLKQSPQQSTSSSSQSSASETPVLDRPI